MKATSRALPALLLFASISALGAPIDPASREEAQARFDRGREFYEEGDFAAALVEFRRANELSPNYKLLYNIAQVCYQLQDYPCALQSFTRYLGDGGADVPAGRVAEVQRELDKLRARVARVVVSTNVQGAEIAVDDVPVGKTPLGSAVLVSAGRRRISASLKGYLPIVKTVEVAGTDLTRLALELTPLTSAGTAPPAPESAERPRERSLSAAASSEGVVGVRGDGPGVKRRLPSPWLWAIPGALVAGGVSMGIWALRVSETLKARLGDLGISQAALVSTSEDAKSFALVADLLFGAAIVSGVTLGLFTVFAPVEEAGDASRPSVTVGVAPGGVAVLGQF